MRIAFVTDDLIQKGGQERLVATLCAAFPKPILYTTAASNFWKKECEKHKIKLITSFVQKLPFITKLNRYYSPFLIHTIGMERFRFDDFDVVVSISSRYAHHIITKPKTKHICYMNSPGRMFWESHSYFGEESFGILKPLKAFARFLLSYPLNLIRVLDQIAADRPDYFIANSAYTQKKIKKYYRKNSEVIYPPVDVLKLEPHFNNFEKGNYFVVVSRLVSWKRIDIAIMACKKLGINLKIIGEGPDYRRLKQLSDEHIEFLGYISEEKKFQILSKCAGLIHTQKEDFGIVPIEAMALGKPVIAFKAGGVMDTVVEDKTGIMFDEQTPASLISALEDFEEIGFDKNDCRRQAMQFDTTAFVKKIKDVINRVYLETGS